MKDTNDMEKESVFFARAMHDIHTYINSISGAAKIIEQNDTSLQHEEWSSSIKHSCTILHNMINGVLNFSKLQTACESFYCDIVENNYNTSVLFNNIINITKTLLKDNNKILFLVQIDKSIPLNLKGDEDKLRLVILNLITNAIKYTKIGYIKLKMSCKKDSAALQDSIVLNIEVSDSGCGIKKEDMSKIFNEFVRVGDFSDSNDTRIEGTGLGLAIAKSLCCKMNGNIKVKSIYGKGSVFTAKVSAKICGNKKIANVICKKEKIVFVYETILLYKESILKSIKSLGVENAPIEDLCELKYKISSTADYKEVFIFVQKNDYHNVKRIVKETTANNVVIISLSGMGEYKTDTDVLHISMPANIISISAILNKSKDIIKSKEVKHTCSAITAPSAKALIVDDNDINLTILKGFLSPYKMQITCCRSGKECLYKLHKNSDIIFDIIFMDYMMSDFSGIETTIELRKIKEYKTVPVIAVTAGTAGNHEEIFLQSGMNGVLIKPIDTNKLAALLVKNIDQKKILLDENFIKSSTLAFSQYGNAERRETDRRSGERRNKRIRQEERRQNIFEQDKILNECSCIKGLNVEEGLLFLDGNKKAYFKILRQYCINLDKEIKSIINDIENRQWKNYAIKIHSYKGVFAMIGLDSLAVKTEKLEIAGKNAAGITFNGAFIDPKKVRECERICKVETADLLSSMKTFKDKLLKTSLFAQENKIKLKIDNATLLKKLNMLEDDCLKCRFSSAVDSIEELLNNQYNKKTSEKIQKLHKSIVSMEYEEAIDIIKTLACAVQM